MKSQMTKETQHLLQQCGRETGIELMRSAVETAKTDEMMSNQLYVAQCAGIHVLATELINREMQQPGCFEEQFQILCGSIRGEFEILSESNENELVTRKQ